jgi:CRISPR/Cas system-associated exonuclease Cas4 (RecB family)
MPIKLPPAFAFSQSSLQDFADCPRRFQLRYLLGQAYPAPLGKPLASLDRSLERGERFHRLMERHWRGIRLPERVDPLVADLWQAFCANPPSDVPQAFRRVEFSVNVKPSWANGARLTAKYDLLAYDPDGDALIVDWKTSRRPPRASLERRLQTVLYPLLLVEAAPSLFGAALPPERVTLLYWFGEDGGETERFTYNGESYAADRAYISALLARLNALDVAEFPLTADLQHCRACQYRALCERDQVSGTFEPEDADLFPDLDELRELIAAAVASDDFVL